ncbi:MAG: glycosyltransferase family 2 protein [Dysgonomonas sp.]|nr:glycosyltransferase family 2 protein [Dysgonomonas sp.]
MRKIDTLTIVLTNYNRPKVILPVIETAYNQNIPGVYIDILIIDDGSVNSIEPNDLMKYGERVQVIKLEQNGGLHRARNAGLENAKSNFVLLADDDDLFIPNSLDKAIKLIEEFAGFEDYPVYQFARTNGYTPTPFLMVTEEHYYCNIIRGDFTPIINKKIFKENNYIYPEYDEIRKISCEDLLWCDIGYKFGIPTWNHIIIETGIDASTRLTNSSNWRKKASQFAILQKFTMNFMEKNGFHKKYPQYYNSKILGLYIYSLLDGKKKLARQNFKANYKGKFLIKRILLLLSFFPASFVDKFLRFYRSILSN